MTISERVVKNWSRINDSEQEILNYLRSHVEELPGMSINALTGDLFISQNTVIRLAKKLGYRGFSEMKYAIVAESKTPAQNSTFSDQLDILSDKALARNIKKTIELIDCNQIAALLRRIRKTEGVSMHGIGDSQYFAELLQKYFVRVCNNVEMQFNILFDNRIKFEQFQPGHVAIFISCSGETETILELATFAKQRGTYTVSITRNTDNRLRHIVDESLVFCGDQSETQIPNVPDLTGLMLLLRYIANAYWSMFSNADADAPEKN